MALAFASARFVGSQPADCLPTLQIQSLQQTEMDMSDSVEAQVSVAETRFWLRDIHRYEHTADFGTYENVGNADSWGLYLDKGFVTEAGEFIGDKPEVIALAAVWYRANELHNELDGVKIQLEHTCNVIASVEDVARHDTELDDNHWQIVVNMQRRGLESSVLEGTTRELEHVLEKLTQRAHKHRGVFRQSYIDSIEGRMNRFIKEGEAMLASFKESQKHFLLPKTPYQIRQFTLSQLARSLEDVLNVVTPLRQKVKNAPIDEEMRRRILDNEAVLLRARSQVKKWRDNPSQRFRGKVKTLVLKVRQVLDDLAKLKDESYHAISKLGVCFYCRTGRCKNPYT